MERTFYKQKLSQIQGPKEKLNFLGNKEEITGEEAEKLLDDYLASKPGKKTIELKLQAWDVILMGESVSFGGIAISSKD